MVAEVFFQIITTDKERRPMGMSDCGGRRGQRVSGIGLIVTNNVCPGCQGAIALSTLDGPTLYE